MKKFLSLVLALVMTFSLVTISAGAKDFTDDETITYEEAVDVISAIGVVDGYTDGSFKPTATLTRGAAAKIICNLILGPTTAAELSADTAPYSDVPVGSTFAGYIAYCQKTGIISGYRDGTFRPSAPLTGYAFLKMLLGALGYDQNTEGYTDANWSINVAKQAIGIGLNAGLESDFVGTKAVNREEAALYAFNTLKADLVDYDTKITATINGESVTIGNSSATAQKWGNSATRINNIKADEYIQFAEQYFPKLVLDDDETDVFGRPANKWTNNKKEIGTYVDWTLLVEEYTAKVTGKDLYTLLGSTAIKNSDVLIYVDGETEQDVLGSAYFTAGNLVKTNTLKIGDTGNGVLTQVFQDTDKDEITIAIINTYLAVADDYNEKDDDLDLTVYKIDDKNASPSVEQYVKTASSTEIVTVKGEDFDIEDYKDGDIVLVTVADGEIQSIEAPETLSDTEINSFKTTSYLTVDGTKYNFASTLQYDSELVQYTDADPTINLKDTTYNVYLDEYGYVIGIEEVDSVTNYVFVTGFDGSYSRLGNKTIDVGAIFTDGTMKTIKVDSKKSIEKDDTLDGSGAALLFSLDDDVESGLTGTKAWANGKTAGTANVWCTYTVNDEGVYTLKVVPFSPATGDGQYADATHVNKDINKKNIILKSAATSSYAYGNDESVYLIVDTAKVQVDSGVFDEIIDDVDAVVTGVQNVNVRTRAATVDSDLTGRGQTTGVYTLFDEDGIVIAAVVDGENQASSTNYAYVISDNVNYEGYDKAAKEYTWTRDVVINGEIVELKYVDDSSIDKIDTASMDQGKWYEVKYYADGTVKDTNPIITYGPLTSSTYYTTLVDYVDSKTNTYDTIILHDTTTVTKLTYSKGTLYTNVAQTNGFAVNAADVKVILGLKVDGKEFDKVLTYTGGTGLTNAIKHLDATAPWTAGAVELSAIVENGVATTIIINDTTGTTTDTGSSVGSGKITGAAITKDAAGHLIATWNDDTSYSGKPVTVKFYQLLDGKSYLKDTVNDTMGSGTAHNATGTATIKETGDYYAVITITDSGKVLAEVTTNAVGLSF